MAASFGGSLVVQVRDPSAIYWNPALLSSLKDRGILLSINEPFGFDFAGFTQFVPLYGTFGVAFSRISTSIDDVDRGTFSWGRKFLKGISFGTSFDIAKQNEKWFGTVGWGLFIGNSNVGSLDYKWQQFSKPEILDRLNLGITIRNIPIVNKLFEPSAFLGASYLLPGEKLLLNAGYHIREGENTKHLGLGLELNRYVTIFTGFEELTFNKWGAGMTYSQDNFGFNLTYVAELKKLLVTLTVRLSPNPKVLAAPYYERGTEYFKSGNYKYAAKELQKYLSYDLQESNSDTARFLVKALEKKSTRKQFVVDSLYIVVDKLLNKREPQYLRAALILTNIIELDENNLKARTKLTAIKPVLDDFIRKSLADGISEYASKKFHDAKNSFKRVLLFDNNNESALLYLSRIDSVFTLLGTESFYRGIGYFHQNNYTMANKEFMRALSYNPNMQEARSYLARTNKKLNSLERQVRLLLKEAHTLEKRKKYIDATRVYNEVLKLDGGNEEARARIAKLKPKQRVEKKSLLEKREKAALYFAQAEKFFQQQDWRSAFELYEEVLELDPSNLKAIQGKKEAQKKLQIRTLLVEARKNFIERKYVEALNDYKKVMVLAPDNVDSKIGFAETKNKIDDLVEEYFNDGINLYTLDRYQEAIEKWDKALQLNPNHKGSLEYKKQAQERIKALKKLN
ncbi:MAG: tetratricopeptide repeat protein [bacterium]